MSDSDQNIPFPCTIDIIDVVDGDLTDSWVEASAVAHDALARGPEGWPEAHATLVAFRAELDQAVAVLAAGPEAWALSSPRRARYSPPPFDLERVKRDLAALQARGLPEGVTPSLD